MPPARAYWRLRRRSVDGQGMDEQNRDHFYEGPPLEEEKTWHDNPAVETTDTRGGARRPPGGTLDDVDLPEGGVYPPQAMIERPHAPARGLKPASLSRDPSYSRAVDRAEDGLPVEGAGYDRSIEGASPGPLDADAEQVPADAGDQPGGQYGSSG
jgi:hypothetical protein